ncbi:MAG: TfoX/Sxy family protein [Geothrix sp.]|uniref:TfoX/Sxy family protein n=1 Tax=Geothrix sp. TaxID=1962974 RepID=UPI0017ECE401|nr:TfoX/Sxy family protein [Geothrix sp.]NWJ39465.1 TfoX/Sxy family protein [Geothrix sp.]WIL19311.1 MAG: TfoX/Sxy family protein [Geothrix sp.]
MVAMAVSVSFRTYLLEQLGQIRPITTRPMFGGLTFFAEGRAFALADDGVIYFKVDDSNRPDFVAAGKGPFLPFGDPDRPMQYYELPEEVLEDPEALAQWMARAIAVAMKAKPKAKSKAKSKAKTAKER